MSPRLSAPPLTPHGFPRVSGDEPGFRAMLPGVTTFSPREWG